jgi:hypothetical protein
MVYTPMQTFPVLLACKYSKYKIYDTNQHYEVNEEKRGVKAEWV